MSPRESARKTPKPLRRADSDETIDTDSDEDDMEDQTFERRHQPFEQLERLGYELMASSFALMARCE